MGCFTLEAQGTYIVCSWFFRPEALNLKNGYIEGTRDVEHLVRLSGLASQDAHGVWIYRRILVSDVSGLVPLSTYRMAKIPGAESSSISIKSHLCASSIC